MSEDGKLMMALICGATLVLTITVAGYTAVQLNRGWLDGGYVTIDGEQMRCVSLQVTQTESAADCDWDSIR